MYKMDRFNWALSKLPQGVSWRAVFGGFGKGVQKVAPGVGATIDRLKDVGAFGVEMLETTSQEVASSAPPIVPPLQTSVPPVGSVEVVVYVQNDDGSIDRLGFGWTPEKNLFMREEGWYRYKEADR